MAGPNWSNRAIWTGGCLEIMRDMNSESVDLIYLDLPLNPKANYAAPIRSKTTGAAFKNTWTLHDVGAEWINLIEAKHPALWRITLAAMTGNDKHYLSHMAARLLEMRRLLKPAGSICLHCGLNYLKLVMDAVFGRRAFQDEIICCYGRGAACPGPDCRENLTSLPWSTLLTQHFISSMRALDDEFS